MNFDGMKIYSRDEHVTNMVHPSGHMVRVVHKALSPSAQQMLSQVPQYFSGGSVENTGGEAPTDSTPQVLTEKQDIYNKQVALDSAVPGNLYGGNDVTSGLERMIAPGDAPGIVDPTAAAAATNILEDHATEASQNASLTANQAARQDRAKADLGLMSETASASQPDSVQDLAQPAVTTSTTGPSDAEGTSRLTSAFGEIGQGLKQEAAAQGDLGKANAKTLSGLSANLKEQQLKNEQELAGPEAENAALMTDIKNGHIDPRRYMGSMSTSGKISTAIGLILGGISAGLTHGENPAAKYLQAQIDNDILAQKAELGKKENLLSANMKIMGNLRDAQAMTKVNMMDMAKLEMEAQAAKASDPLARARLQTELGKLDMQKAQLLAPLEMKHRAMQAIKRGEVTPEKAIDLVVPEKDRDKAREELTTINGYKAAVQSINDIFSGISEIGAIGANVPYSDSKTKFEAARAQITNAIKQNMKGLGAFTDSDQKYSVDPLLPKGSDTKDQLRIKQMGLNELLANKVRSGTPILSSNGIMVNKQVNALSSEDQRLYNFAKANPSDKRSKEILKRLSP